MKAFLKSLFWKLPFPQVWKEIISRKRYERILRQEEMYDKKNVVDLIHDKEQTFLYAQFVLEQYGKKSEYYKEYEEHVGVERDIHVIAYYLTQYHPNKWNDEWWGKGVTEWNNVNQAIPQFVGHYQPRKPGELGYYDLRLKEVMARQIELAKNYGVSAFCFYYYWFDGERLLERPLNMFLQNKDLDIQFCYCWANENWTKRFSGTDEGVLMKITPSLENYQRFIEAVLNDFQDERYYRIDGKPALSVYRPSLIPEVNQVLTFWRERAKSVLGKDIYIIAVQERDSTFNWTSVGFDAETEFQPKQIQHECRDITRKVNPIRKDFAGSVYDYEHLVNNRIYYIDENRKKKVYPAIMPMWDNSARRNFRGLIFHGSTPKLYQKWLVDILKDTVKRKDLDDNLVFINAWNEWGEGTYLEPDQYYGYAYLQATYDAIMEAECDEVSLC